MKTFPLAAVAWLVGVAIAGAQEPQKAQLNRGDVHFVLGWQNLHKPQEPDQHYNNWVNGIFFGGGGAGWYWTDNLKTQVDIGAGTTAQQYRYAPIVSVGGVTTGGVSSRLSVRESSLTVAQQYQFFRNQMFHPHVGAGVEIARETTREQYDPIFIFDPVTRVSRQTSPARIEGPEQRWIARPFAEGGFKAYMTQRVFFTGDARLMFRTGIDEVLFRAGFGIDF